MCLADFPFTGFEPSAQRSVQPGKGDHDRIEEVNLTCPDGDIGEQGHVFVNDQLPGNRELLDNLPVGNYVLGDDVVRGLDVRRL